MKFPRTDQPTVLVLCLVEVFPSDLVEEVFEPPQISYGKWAGESLDGNIFAGLATGGNRKSMKNKANPRISGSYEKCRNQSFTITWDDYPTSCWFQQIMDNPLAEAVAGCKDSRTYFVLIRVVTSLDGKILHYLVDVLNLSQLPGFTAKISFYFWKYFIRTRYLGSTPQ